MRTLQSNWLTEVPRKPQATERLSMKRPGSTPKDRHGSTLLPDYGIDWTDMEAVVILAPKPKTRGVLGRYRATGYCEQCFVKLPSSGECDCE